MAQMYSAIWQYRHRDLFLLRTPGLGSENNTWYMYVNVYLKYTRLNTCFCFISFLRICGGKHRPIQIFSHIFSLRRSGTLPVFSVCPAMFARQTYMYKSYLNYNMLINKLHVLTIIYTVCLYTPLPFVHQLTNRPTHTVMITPRALNHKQEIPQNLSSPSLKFKKQEIF